MASPYFPYRTYSYLWSGRDSDLVRHITRHGKTQEIQWYSLFWYWVKNKWVLVKIWGSNWNQIDFSCCTNHQHISLLSVSLLRAKLLHTSTSAWIFMALNYYNAHARFPQENGWRNVWFSMEECWIFATERFQRKPYKFFDLHCPLSTWKYFRTNKRSRGETWLNRPTHRPTTVPLLRMRAEG